MSSELGTIQGNLIVKKEKLEAERQAIIEKLSAGESISRKEIKRNKELASEIKEITEQLAKFAKLEQYIEVKKNLNELNNTGLTKEEKNALISKITKSLLEIANANNEEIKESIDHLCLEVCLEELNITGNSLSEIKDQLSQKCAELESDKVVLERHGQKTDVIDAQMGVFQNLIQQIDTAISQTLSEEEIKNDLKALSLAKTSKIKKQQIIDKYSELINSYIEPLEEELQDIQIEDEIEEEEEKSLKAKAKEKLAKMKDYVSQHKKLIAGVAGTVILGIALIFVAKEFSKSVDNDNNDLKDPTPNSIESVYDNRDRENIEALTAKGYDEYSALLMIEHFSKDTIEALLKLPYIASVPRYATVKDFNLDYVNDYDVALTTYTLAPEDAVSYVNRAYQISATNFYEGASINEIVEVVMAVNDKDIFKSENAALDNSINNTMVDAIINYINGDVTEENINKMNALPYFAKEGSDLEAFLKEYSTILQNIIRSTNDKEALASAQNDMYTYLYAFANAHNGYVEKGSDIVVNENAIVKDTFDWYIAYESFVKPAMSLFINEANLNDFVCLQETMLGIVNTEPYSEYCHEEYESLTRGGE